MSILAVNDHSPVLSHSVSSYVSDSIAENTRIAYEQDRRHAEAFIRDWSPVDVAEYLALLGDSGYSVATIERRYSSLCTFERLHDLQPVVRDPLVVQTLRGIKRRLGTRQRRVNPFTVEMLRQFFALTANDDDNGTLRDRALLAVGFAGALRRSELVALTVDDLAFEDRGCVVTIRRSKTDQTGAGRQVVIPNGFALKALVDWLQSAEIREGFVFRGVHRSGRVRDGQTNVSTVVRVVKRAAEMLGHDSTDYSGHSLRAGFATSAALNGASERNIQRTTGHKSVTVLRRYIREATIWDDAPATDLLGS